MAEAKEPLNIVYGDGYGICMVDRPGGRSFLCAKDSRAFRIRQLELELELRYPPRSA